MGYQLENQLNVFPACPGCAGLSCWALSRCQMEKPPHTFCHLGNFGSESTCGCPTPNSHTKLSAIQETQKKREEFCAKHLPDKATACTSPYAREQNHHTQAWFWIKSICNAAQMQMFIVAGQTTGLFGLRGFFYDLFNFKINFSLWNTY